MTLSGFKILQDEHTLSDEQSVERDHGRLEFTLKQKERSSAIPETTLEHNIAVSESAIQTPSKDYQEVDDKFVQWIGRVLEISGETFTARIDPIRQKTTPKIARFNIRKVTVVNGEQLEEGATFYWTVGLFRNPKGSFMRKSEVRFRFPIIPNREAVDELAWIKAKSLFEGIGWLE